MPLPMDPRQAAPPPPSGRQKEPADFDFPLKGLDENWAYKAQPEGTTPSCLNVRPFDVTGQRMRGGQRPGLSKYFATQPSGSMIQRLDSVIIDAVVTAGTGAPLNYLWTQTDGSILNPSDWQGITGLGGSDIGTGPVIHPADHILWASSTSVGAIYKKSLDVSGGILVGVQFKPTNGPSVGTASNISVLFGQSSPHAAGGGYVASIQLSQNNSSTPYGTGLRLDVAGINAMADSTFVANTPTDWAYWSVPRMIVVAVSGTAASVFIGAVTADPADFAYEFFIGSVTTPLDVSAGQYAGWQTNATSAGGFVGGGGSTLGWQSFTNTTGGSGGGSGGGNTLSDISDEHMIVAVSGGNVYAGNKTPGLTLATSGAGVLTQLPLLAKSVQDYGQLFFCDGTYADYCVFDPTTMTVTTWLPAAYQANKFYSVGDLVTYSSAVYAANVNNLDSAWTSGHWTVQSGTYSYLPTDSTGLEACSIMARYRGRIVMAGLASDPQNWFMSEAGNPYNWNYGTVPITVTMPIAGNNSDAGLVGDTITCLAPYNDDLMVIGGTQSIWLMRGDPADGGRIDAISHLVGIIGPNAWCLDAQGNMYFFGGGVFYRMGPVSASTMYQKTLGGMPEPLSRGRLDNVFSKVDGAHSNVQLVWDETLHGVHIFITPLFPTDGSIPAIHYWWDARTDSFWPMQFPLGCGPTAATVFQSPNSTTRAVLVGGQDGYIRQIDATANDDDGESIYSQVAWGPQNAGSVHKNSRINRLTTILDQTSDPVTVNLYAAQSPQEVVQVSDIAFSYQASPVNRYAIPRVQGNSLLLEIVNNSFRTAWLTSVTYTVGFTIVGPDSNPYICAKDHISGVFATDLTAGDWTLSNFRTWALETIAVTRSIGGRTRHGRM